MAPSRTRTVKNKHAANKSGIRNSKSAKDIQPDVVIKAKKSRKSLPLTTRAKGRPSLLEQLKKRKQKVYTEKELGLPKLNMVTPAGVQKPRGKKKDKIYVDDRESMSTILALVQAEREGKIESKLLRARQMEEIREARKAEMEKKEADKKSKFDETKESLRRKRRRRRLEGDAEEEPAAPEPRETNGKRKKRVSFA